MRSQKGFTIVELLLYMGIFSILLVILLQIFTSILSLHTESQTTSSVDQDSSAIINRLTYDIHSASSISAPGLGTSCTWPTLPSCQLTLGGGTTYTMSGNNLMLTAGGHTAGQLNSINTKITSITFTTLGNTAAGSKPSMQIQFTLQSVQLREGGTATSQTFETTVATR